MKLVIMIFFCDYDIALEAIAYRDSTYIHSYTTSSQHIAIMICFLEVLISESETTISFDFSRDHI